MLKKIILTLIMLIVGISIVGFIINNNYKKHQEYSQDNATIPNITVDINRKLPVTFSKNAIDNIALITMVKDESDIIFENLAWHFTIGFRKFIIVDNASTDGTAELIVKFANLTKNHAQVFVINDPIFDYIQNRIMTGAHDFARSIWYNVDWYFPVDANEFWTPERNLADILADIPYDKKAISTLKTNYWPAEDYDEFLDRNKFYDKIHYRTNKLPLVTQAAKVAFRSDKGLNISQGSHTVGHSCPYPNILERLKLVCNFDFIGGNILGLQMREYHVRSSEHTHRKFFNGMRANKSAKKNGLLAKQAGTHWDSYEDYIEKYGSDAGKVKFREYYLNKDGAIDDPLPIEDSMKLFYEITSTDVQSSNEIQPRM